MEAFFTEWVRQEESLVSSLLAAILSNDLAHQSRLVSLAVAHIEAFYLHKSRLAEQDVVQAFYPRYLTPFERTFLWLGGFKPSLAFKFIPPEPASSDTIVHLRRSILAEERDMSKQMAALQESLAARELLEAIRIFDHRRNGDNSMERAATEVGDGLRELLASADRLRLCTLRAIMEALVIKPADVAIFVANAMKFHLNVRRFGLQCDNRGD
ncbi:transcription factor-like protein [Rhynchospora pubera]|uniref:Transcription factor-like protein n=1 Tax=Rhynchospora pubera TaxID=906938 RepID=A0AAV8AQT4_9POAL|nr:transcription factor-like protein [Rhynchospora pubera]KAJ4775968.1 transcription factor-like protein [Rhynchospora pubera]